MRFTEPVYRPPTEANSLLIPVMQSCAWNKCNFCHRGKNHPLLVATPEEVETAAVAQKPFYPEYASIFLVGYNTFAISAKKLEEYIKILRKHYPRFQQPSMFARIDAITAKTHAELEHLASLAPLQLYVGAENGNDEALALMNKGHTAAEALDQLKRLDKAGIRCALFYIIGMGGKGAGQISGKETAELFNHAHPMRIISTGMTVTEGTGAAIPQKEGKFIQASEREKIEELGAFLRHLKTDAFYDGIHYLNPLHFRFQNSDAAAKEKVLAEIDRILASHSDEELEEAINRPAMEEACKPERLSRRS